MDIIVLSCCVPVVITVFGLFLYYATRETSYEQALEEQRSKNDFDLLVASGSVNKNETKKDKVMKKSNSKKFKEKHAMSQNKIGHQRSSANSGDKVEKKSREEKQLIGNAIEEKPIRLKPVEEVVHEIDSRDVKQVNETYVQPVKVVPVEIETAKALPLLEHNAPLPKEDLKVIAADDSGSSVSVKSTENAKSTNKKTKKASSAKVSKDLTLEDIMESVKLFTNEDVTVLTDYLLNIQADQINDHNWHKKNDPLDTLKKQLAEKEETISTQKINLDAAKRKLEAMQHEIQQQKKKAISESKLRADAEKQKAMCLSMVKDLEVKNQQQLLRFEEQTRLFKQEEIAKFTDVINGLKAKLAENDNYIRELTNQNHELASKIEEQEESINRQASLRDEDVKNSEVLQEELKTFKSGVENYKYELEQAKAKLAEVKKQNDELKQQLLDLQNEKNFLEQEKKKNEESVQALNQDLKTFRNFKDELSAQVEKLKNENETLTSQLKNSSASSGEKVKVLSDICTLLRLNSENTDNLMETLNDLMQKSHSHNELQTKFSDLNNTLQRLSQENETLKEENSSLIKKSEDYESTLSQTDKTLNEIQDKIIKERGDFEVEQAKKEEVITNLQDQLQQSSEKVATLVNETELLKQQLRDSTELVPKLEVAVKSLEEKQNTLSKELEAAKEDNKLLKCKNDKLNNLVQIGIDTYQEENRKVQDLESKLAMLNGKENNAAAAVAATNGN